jgi:hypothetical protein
MILTRALPVVLFALCCVLWLGCGRKADGAPAADSKADKSQKKAATAPAAITQGQRIFGCGHSFYCFVPPIEADIARAAGIQGHEDVGLSPIGGSHIYQHWNVPDAENQAKKALLAGKVDVLCLAPLHLPDDGIEKFAELGLKYNPNIRVTVEEIWMPHDSYDPTFPNCKFPDKVDHNAATGEMLDKLHAPYIELMDAHIRALNKKYGKDVLFAVPAAQAVVALRKKIIAGQAPGLKTQEDIFSDPICHPQPPLQVLVAYCHFAVIYRRSPVGLPMPAILANAKNPNWDEKLNRLLQEIAWDVVSHHPLSGAAVPQDN